jgi:four helix bundle protein
MGMAKHFTELDCRKLADELRVNVVRIANRPVIRRDRDYREDMLDAAASAPNNIAEGFGRRTHADFAHFLDNARGSLQERQSQFKDGCDRVGAPSHLRTLSEARLHLAKRIRADKPRLDIHRHTLQPIQHHLHRRPHDA